MVCRVILEDNKGHGGLLQNMPTRKLYFNRSRDSNENNLMTICEVLYSGNNVVKEHMPGLLDIFNDFDQWQNFIEVSRWRMVHKE